MKKGVLYGFAIGFFALIAVCVFLLTKGIPGGESLIALPTLYLAVITFIPKTDRNIWLPIGLLLSAAGDLVGSLGIFQGQVLFFAAAHIAYIIFFLGRAWFRPSSLFLGLLLATAVTLLGVRITREIDNPSEKVLIVCYIVMITAMGVTAVFGKDRRHWWYVVGALLFIFSDAVIAWHRYIAEVPYRSIIVLSAYYIAQFVFAFTYLSGHVRKTRSLYR